MNKKLTLLIGAALLCGAVSVQAAENLSEFTLDEMSVTAMRYEKSLLDTPADVSVYTGEALMQTGAADVAGALKYKAGVYFSQMGPHDQSWITGNSTVSLRGIKGGTLVLLNGVPMSFNNVSHLDMVPLGAVERVEVVKGGGAVLYGSEAYGGVVNIITKDGYQNQVGIALGNKGQHNYKLALGLDRVGITAGREEMGEVGNITRVKGTKTINGVKIPYYMGFGDSKKNHLGLTYKIDDNLTAEYMYNQKKYTIDYNDADENTLQHFMYDDREHFTQLRYDDKNGGQAKIYYNERSIRNPDYYVVNKDNLEWERSKHRHFGADGQKVWNLDKDTALLGASLKRETYVDENQKFKMFGNSASPLKPEARFGTYGLNGYSLYGQYDKHLSDATHLILSMREDMIRSDAGNYNAFLPQLQAITKLGENSSLYANAGRSFRMPTFRQLYYSSGVILKNLDLKPEYGWNYEVGFKNQGADDSFKVALFRIDLKDQITSRRVTVGGTSMSQSYNAARYRNAGVEAEYNKKLDSHWDMTVGGIYSKPENKANDNSAWKDVLGRYQLMTAVNWHDDKNVAAINLSYMGKRVNNSSQKGVKPLLLSNIHYGYSFNDDASFTFDVNNVFNRKDLSDPDGDFYTLGRTFMAGVQYKF